jgi:tRNA threonylcarbamoyladenosine biosynthesis protein TsaE
MTAVALADLAATEAFAQALAPLLADGDVLELVGEIGAGKTTFTGALARALGSTDPVRSPTYTIAHRYELPADGPSGATFLAHLDCYRQRGTLDDAAWGDLEPYFEGGIACIEWPAPIRPWIIDRRTWRLELDAVTVDARVARLTAPAGVDATRSLLSGTHAGVKTVSTAQWQSAD